MGIAGTQLGATIGHQVGVNTDWNQPNAGGGGGGGPAPPWDISGMSLTPDETVASDTTATGMVMSPDGLHVITLLLGDIMRQWALSTAYDISTATSVRTAAVGHTNATGLFVSPDGTQLLTGVYTSEDIYTRTLSTAWDISTQGTASILGAGRTGDVQTISFNADGTKCILGFSTSEDLEQYTCSTPWDFSTATADTKSFSDVTNLTNGIGGAWWVGDQFFVLNLIGKVAEFEFGTEDDVSTLSHVQSVTITSPPANPQGLVLRNGSVYHASYTVGSLYQFDGV